MIVLAAVMTPRPALAQPASDSVAARLGRSHVMRAFAVLGGDSVFHRIATLDVRGVGTEWRSAESARAETHLRRAWNGLRDDGACAASSLTRARLMVGKLFELTSGTCGFVMAGAVALRVD